MNATMNATSLFVSTSRLVLQANAEDPASWLDLYRLVPYLRQSLSCTVCGNLLIQPYTPVESNCQHHVCRSCKGGRKKLKPTCSWCKNYEKYNENIQLRILLQCYKKLCEYVTSTAIFSKLTMVGNNVSSGTTSLKDLIQEGAGFRDVYKSQAGLSKSAYSILPCIYTSTSTQTQTALAASRVQSLEQPVSQNNGLSPLELLEDQSLHPESSLYSVMYPGDGNKITIKRKATDFDQVGDGNSWSGADSLPLSSLRKLGAGRTGARSRGGARTVNKRKGCRCGNATPTPGKLTCCGQRCPCYVASKACMECRCRGCRNPHRPGGHKVRPMLQDLQSFEFHHFNSSDGTALSFADASLASLDDHCLTMDSTDLNSGTVEVLSVYAAQRNGMETDLPSALLVDDTDMSEISDIDIDVDM